MKIELRNVAGVSFAIEAMHASYKNYDISDSYDCIDGNPAFDVLNIHANFENMTEEDLEELENNREEIENFCQWNCKDFDSCINNGFCSGCFIGPKDRALTTMLSEKSSSERKHLRFIQAYMVIEAPLYWWKEFDTYRAGVEKDSESTMHTLMKFPITVENFNLNGKEREAFRNITNVLENLRNDRNFNILNKMLPQSWLQKRYVMASYEALKKIYQERKNHKLIEWHIFRNFIETLPYSELLITGNLEDNPEKNNG